MIRSYSDLKNKSSFMDRFNYLVLQSQVGESTFGFDRYLNQVFYRSYEWSRIRDQIIIRDNGCDLGVPGFEIRDKIIVHHMNVVTVEDIKSRSSLLLNPEYLICVSENTHLAIHYNDKNLIKRDPVERHSGDTRLW